MKLPKMKNKFVSTFLFIALLALLFFVVKFFSSFLSQGKFASIPDSYSGKYDNTRLTGIFRGKVFESPKLTDDDMSVLAVARPDEKWIEVDLSEQKLRAWDGNSLYLETPVATGLPWWPTPQGEFRIWIKLRYSNMEGGEGKYYYNLPNVPYVMYFFNDQVPAWKGYGLHGTYWHNSFGTPRSHGCVNLPTSVAKSLYYWTTPVATDGAWSTYATPDNPGTRIVIHE